MAIRLIAKIHKDLTKILIGIMTVASIVKGLLSSLATVIFIDYHLFLCLRLLTVVENISINI